MEPIFSAVWVTAKFLTDRDTRLLSLEDYQVTDAKFPDQDPAKIDPMKINNIIVEATIKEGKMIYKNNCAY